MHDRLYHDGFVAIPLFDVLAILQLEQDNDEDCIRVVSRVTGKVIIKRDRDVGIWNTLKGAGYLKPENLLPLAEKYYA